MKKFGALLVLLIHIQSCVTTAGIENPSVKEAIELQSQVFEDELFIKILKELEQNSTIVWGDERLSSVDKTELEAFDNNMDWLLEKYRSQGVYAKDSVFLWRKWNPFSKTTAVTTTCNKTTKLNKWRIKRTTSSILNTLIHERVHSFCVGHVGQSRSGNECDPSYVVGDLAQIILLYRNGVKEQTMNKPFCQDLKTLVEKYNLIVIN